MAMPPLGLVPLDAANDPTTQACAGSTWEPPPISVALELLIDVSTSMTQQPPAVTPGDTRSKWEITRDALIAAVDHLPATVEEIDLCRDTCAYVKADPFARISLLVGCPVITG